MPDQWTQYEVKAAPDKWTQYEVSAPVQDKWSQYEVKSPQSGSQQLRQIAEQEGLGAEAESVAPSTPKMTMWERLGVGLTSTMPIEAAMRVHEEAGGKPGLGRLAKFIPTYAQTVKERLTEAATGERQGTARSFSDLSERDKLFGEATHPLAKVGKFVANTAGDIVTDPGTFFGGKPVQLVGWGIGKGAQALGKAVPAVAETGQKLKDAAGRLFVHGYGTTPGLPERALETMERIKTQQAGILKTNLEDIGKLDPTQRKEFATVKEQAKRAELTARQAAETLEGPVKEAQLQAGKQQARSIAHSDDPVVQKVIETQKLRDDAYAKAVGVKNPYEVYWPALKADRLGPVAAVVNKLRVSNQPYLKKLTGKLGFEEMVQDPVEAVSRRQIQMAKDVTVREDLTSIVKDMGKPVDAFANEQEALKAGFQLIKEKGAGPLGGKPLGYLPQNDVKFLDDMINPADYQAIKTLSKYSGLDAFNRVFRGAVTVFFPAFHVRNLVSGVVQNYERLGPATLNPKTLKDGQRLAFAQAFPGERQLGKTLTLPGGEVSLNAVLAPFEKRFPVDATFVGDVTEIAQHGLKKPGVVATVMKPVRTVTALIEQQQKATAYLASLKQGKSVEAALKAAADAGFNYKALTQFESNVMRRLFLFYPFMRKNAELQLRTLGENPQRIAQIMKVTENVGEKPPLEERKDLPAYMREQATVKAGETPQGMKQYISGFGTPVEEFVSHFPEKGALKQAQTGLQPILKWALESRYTKGSGQESFRDRPIKEIYDAKEFARMPQMVKDWLQIKQEIKPIWKKDARGKLVKAGDRIVYVANPDRLHLARSLNPLSRFVTTANVALGGEYEAGPMAVKLGTGLKPQQVDLEFERDLKEKKTKKELEEMLTRHGKGYSFSKFIPNKKEP